jgi:hypothetical protein
VTAYIKSGHQVSCKIDGEVAILHLDRAVYFGLRGVGAEIWQALEQPRSVEELRDVIVATFDVSPQQCEQDIREILCSLQGEGLVEAVV